MNTFVNAARNVGTTTRTENGDVTFSSSLNMCVDLFFQGGAIRTAEEERIESLFSAAFYENPELAMRIMLYLRDVREGQGERRVFRTILKYLEKYDVDYLLRILHLVPVLGRWDDLFEVMNNEKSARAVLGLYAEALRNGDGLAAKWAPREKQNRRLAARLKNFLGMNWTQYRKLIVEASNTVEQKMCAKQWDQINYSHVPSVASARYAKAFRRNDEARYQAYLEAVRTKTVDPSTGKVAKINTSAVYPYDVIKPSVDDVTADTMWNELPDFVPEGMSFMPIVDVSGSMSCAAAGNTTGANYVTCMDVAVSLGIYLAERNKSVFKNHGITFSTHPAFFEIPGGTIRQKVKYVISRNWDMTTNLDAAMRLILETAIKNRVPQEDMPNTLIVLSDMEFDSGGYCDRHSSVADRTKARFSEAGYKMPNIVWWNIQSRNGSTPVRSNEHGMALVSGFSPSIMTSLLGGDMTPENIMLKAVMKDRYAH